MGIICKGKNLMILFLRHILDLLWIPFSLLIKGHLQEIKFQVLQITRIQLNYLLFQI